MKMLVLVIMLVIVPNWAQAAAESCTPGHYKGKIWSVSNDLNGKTGTLTVSKQNEKCVMHFKTEGARETWEFSGHNLVQKEFDRFGKLKDQYGATLQEGKYIIDCQNREKNKCDAGIDHRQYWLITITPDEVIYSVFGVGLEKKADKAAQASKRHEFSFKKLETPAKSK